MVDPDGASGSTAIHQMAFVYDGAQIALQFEKTGTGDISASGLSHRYLWGPAVDQLLADEHVDDLETAGDVVWPLVDQLNTVRDLAIYDSNTDTTTIANHRVYDAYGNLKSQTNSAVDCVFGFTGRQFDESTGLQNNLNRWYDAKVGRWTSEDTSGFGGDDGNLYRYVGNRPINATDPDGKHWYFLWIDHLFNTTTPEVIRQTGNQTVGAGSTIVDGAEAVGNALENQIVLDAYRHWQKCLQEGRSDDECTKAYKDFADKASKHNCRKNDKY
jgi:RHS repeat-associated protein